MILKDIIKFQKGSVISDFNNLPLQDRKNYVYSYLKNKGLGDVQIHGIIGNAMVESGLSTRPSGSNDNGNSAGMFQWNGVRKKKLLSRKNPYHVNTQLDLLIEEINDKSVWRNNSGGRNAFMAATSVAQAAKIFSDDWERPSIPHLNRRIEHAMNSAGIKYDPANIPEISDRPASYSTDKPATHSTDMPFMTIDYQRYSALTPTEQAYMTQRSLDEINARNTKLEQDLVKEQQEKELAQIQQVIEAREQERKDFIKGLPQLQSVVSRKEGGSIKLNFPIPLVRNGGTVMFFQEGGGGKRKPTVEEYRNSINKGYRDNFNKDSGWGDAPTYHTPFNKKGVDTQGMNCIHGVCYLIENLTDLDLKEQYTGNMTFDDNAVSEGFYKVNPLKDGWEIGDIIQNTKRKDIADRRRFTGKVSNPKIAAQQVPQHAVIVLDKIDKGGGEYEYVIGNNGGSETMLAGVRTHDDLIHELKGGDFGGSSLQTWRYDPDYTNNKNAELERILSGDNEYASLYDHDLILNEAVMNDKWSEINKGLIEGYKELGKGSNMDPYTLRKLVNNLYGIAEQETSSGDDVGGFRAWFDDGSKNLAAARRLQSFFRKEDNWFKDYWDKNADNVQEEFESYDSFLESQRDPLYDQEAAEYERYYSPRSKGWFAQKGLSPRGRYHGYEVNDEDPAMNAKAAMALHIDNYHILKEIYPNLNDDELLDLTILMHNAPSKAKNERFVNYYLKNNDIDYVNKVKEALNNFNITPDYYYELDEVVITPKNKNQNEF